MPYTYVICEAVYGSVLIKKILDYNRQISRYEDYWKNSGEISLSSRWPV